MANIKISALTPVTTVVPGTDVAPLVSGGITTKATPQQIVNAGLLAPGAIGSGTASTGAFTTLSASSTVSGTGFSTYLLSPPAIGTTAPAAGKFTDLTSTGNTTIGDASTDTFTVYPQTISLINSTAITAASTKTLTLNGGAGSNGVVLDASNNVYINDTTSSYGYTAKLFVRNDVATSPIIASINKVASGDTYGIINSCMSNGNSTNSYHFSGVTQGVGQFYLYGNGTSSFTSDERKKKNIETTRDGYLEDLCKLRVVKYNWWNDEDSTPKELGLIAQEVEKVFPGLIADGIHPDIDGQTYKVMKGSVIPFMLLKAIQELSEKNNILESRLIALEKTN